MEVCRMRSIPVMVFINKLDREGSDPFVLLEELKKELPISVRPLTWPIGMVRDFKGVYQLYKRQHVLSAVDKKHVADAVLQVGNLDSPLLDETLGVKPATRLREEVELIEAVFAPFDLALYRSGYLAPVFFGSAVNNFGIRELLDTFVDIAPEPLPRATALRTVGPDEERFSGFIFKIHANLDPNHRDRIAFCRVCSGTFHRNTFYLHTRLGKKLKFASPTSFMADRKHLVETAWPGDVVGLYDTGNFKIGDTLTQGEDLQYLGIPSFSPELFRELENRDPLKTKQLGRAHV